MRLTFLCLLLISIILTPSFSAFAQTPTETPKSAEPEVPKPRFWDRIYVGGNVGAQFGAITVVNLSPVVGYRITDKLSAGLGVTYQYYSIKTYNYDTHMYGGRVFGRYQLFSFLFLHAEFEEMNWNCPRNEPSGFTTERLWSPGFLAGGGFSQPIGGGGSLFIMGLYNVLYNDCSPYGSPLVLRIGANFGL